MGQPMMEALFPAHAMAPAVRARIALLRDRMLAAGGVEVTCGGFSMEPTIKHGSRVVVQPGKARVGCVAAFVTSRGELELHRLIGRAPGGWWAHLGDNQVDPTPGLVHDSHMIGLANVADRGPSPGERVRALARFGRAALVVARRSRHPR